MIYDIFISYRSEGGFETAKHLNDLLIRDGYNVSFDKNMTREGDFDKILFERIEQCRDFLVVVDQHAFDRMINPAPDYDPKKDWMRVEIAYALKLKRNIVSVLLPGASYPKILPEDLDKLDVKNGPKYSEDYYDHFYDTLKNSFLHSVPRNVQHPIHETSLQSLEIKTKKGSYVIKIDDLEFKMVHVEGDTFIMGATPEQEEYAEEKERPAHSVIVDDFWIGETPVTQALWEKVMGYNPSYFSQTHGYDDSRRPVEQVTWNDCHKFIDKLNNAFKDKLKKYGIEFDFPTENQWEFAARGGKNGKKRKNPFVYAGGDILDEVARYDHNAEGKTWPVAGLKPNELGLYDMSGNVWEWCKNLYAEYNKCEGKGKKKKCVGRGGCWHSEDNCCRVSFRESANMTHAGNGLGLRLVLNKL